MSLWLDEVRLARIRRAGKRRHRRCPKCRGQRRLCRRCGQVTCPACLGHYCPQPKAPRTYVAIQRRSAVLPKPFATLVWPDPLHAVEPGAGYNGFRLVFTRPAEPPLVTMLEQRLPPLPAGWSRRSTGADQKGTWYVELAYTAPDTP